MLLFFWQLGSDSARAIVVASVVASQAIGARVPRTVAMRLAAATTVVKGTQLRGEDGTVVQRRSLAAEDVPRHGSRRRVQVANVIAHKTILG